MTRRRIPLAEAAADDRLARAAWSRLTEPSVLLITQFIEAHGGHGPALLELERGGSPVAERLAARLEVLDVGADLFVAEARGLRIVVPTDEEWPAGLDDLPAPPHCLWVRGSGQLADLCDRSVAVVGARDATHYGTSVASGMSADLTSRGWTVVSGAAFGIDAAAHRGALSVGGGTVAVLATGADRSYPVAHADLLDRIAATGVVLSEQAPGCAALSGRFLTRNRLIAALTAGTVVVEAGLRSGSLNTARHAEKLGRYIGYVPGPVTSVVSAGCHAQLRDNVGTLVVNAEQVLELVSPMGFGLLDLERGPESDADLLPQRELAVWRGLPARATTHPTAVARTAALAESEVVASLARLELLGLAERHDGGWRRVRASRN